MAEEYQKKILIVEDHLDMMTILKRNLEDQNYHIIEAENAEIGIEKFKSDHPDLILMDIMLPGMSGLEAIQHIKQIQKSDAYIPIIIITAKNDIEDIVTGFDMGAVDYVIKPFNFEELNARIESALRIKELNELSIKQSVKLETANKEIGTLNQTLVGKNKELRQNVFNLHTLFEVSLELTSILELDRLINSTLLTLIGQFSCKNALFFYAHHKSNGNLELLNTKGFYENEIKGFILEKNDPVFEFLSRKPSPTLVKELLIQGDKSAALNRFLELQIEIIAPLLTKGSIEGLICMGPRVKKQAFQENEIEHLSILCNLISIAINNASLYEQIEELSYTDGMTELHNYRYFELRLKEEIVRHKRTESGLALLLMDVDHFKNYNDTMGHPAGDEVLRSLAHLLKETVRENDIVSRYGGEEFAAILPAVDSDGAAVLAERIRATVEQTYFEHEEIQPNGKVTISIGIASLPEDSDNAADLIHEADLALYAAKHEGRNLVRTFKPGMKNSKH